MKAKVLEPFPGRKAILSTCVSDPADLTLAGMREHPGTLFEWTLTAGYHEMYGT